MKTLLTLLIIVLIANMAVAQQFSPSLKRVAVFKNGYAFTYREAETKLQNGWVYTTNVPVGALGTVWGYTLSPNARVVQLLASNSDKNESKRIENLAEYLLTNEGARGRFTLNYGQKVVEGTFAVVMQGGDFRTEDKLALDPEVYKRIDANRVSVIVKADTGAIFLPLGQIQTVEILGTPKLDRPWTTKENRLAIKVAGATSENPTVGIAALERGMQWIPAYRVEVKGTPVNEAKLELEAVLVNDMADLTDAEVYFVVGVPHFMFQNEISPLSLNQTFAGVSGNLRNMSQTFSNSIMTSLDGVSGGDISPTVASEEQAETVSAEQLFLYKADALTLKKGERASLRLFSLTVPCNEVFEWTIDDAARPISYASLDGQPIRVPEFTNRFVYGLKLTNKTDMPWTTAPALSFREWRPMGQDMLTFTPVGSDNFVRVTTATEVIGTHKIEEKSRTTEQRRINGSIATFDLITMEGAIHVKNVKKQAVNVSITRNLVGKVITTSDGGQIAREGLNPQADNPRSVIKWDLSVPAGEKDITYTYRVYIRK